MKIKAFPILFFLLFPLLLLGCGKTVTPKTVGVTIEAGEEYMLSAYHFEAERGTDLSVTVDLLEGYAIESVSYENCTFKDGVLTLHDVRYPAFVKITTSSEADRVYYELNGGLFRDGREGDHFILSYADYPHLRFNTSQGVREIVRDGYTLVGWNTSADGSGTHIGLGSRVTPGNQMLRLYAEWVPWNEGTDFRWEQRENVVVLTAYLGNKETETLCVPETVGGFPVTGIATGFCEGVTAEKLILPHTVTSIEDGAFTNSSFGELVCSDLLTEVSDKSFDGCEFVTFRLNAATEPRYQKGNELSWFADMMDRLILHEGDRKLVLFGGCSLSYGIDSAMIDEHFGGEYTVLNMGIIGGTNALFQTACITEHLHEGDVFIHAPEVASGYQLYYLRGAEHRMFTLCEGNYDLLSYVDMRRIGSLFRAFASYNTARLELEPGSYWDCSDAYNGYGDIAFFRQGGADKSYTENYVYATEFLTEDSFAELFGDYRKILERGARVYFTFSPVNRDGLTDEDIRKKSWETFEERIRSGLGRYGIPVIQSAEDCLLAGRWFYDSDYHLTTRGAELRTELLVEALDEVLNEEYPSASRM